MITSGHCFSGHPLYRTDVRDNLGGLLYREKQCRREHFTLFTSNLRGIQLPMIYNKTNTVQETQALGLTARVWSWKIALFSNYFILVKRQESLDYVGFLCKVVKYNTNILDFSVACSTIKSYRKRGKICNLVNSLSEIIVCAWEYSIFR